MRLATYDVAIMRSNDIAGSARRRRWTVEYATDLLSSLRGFRAQKPAVLHVGGGRRVASFNDPISHQSQRCISTVRGAGNILTYHAARPRAVVVGGPVAHLRIVCRTGFSELGLLSHQWQWLWLALDHQDRRATLSLCLRRLGE